MPELLIIEPGTGIANANCYGVTDPATTRAAARTYATARGIALPADDNALSALLVLATDYLGSREAQYYGVRAISGQALAWPRTNIIDATTGLVVASNPVPQSLLNAMYQLCIEQSANSIVLQPSTDYAASGGFVLEEKVDVLTTKYSERIGTTRNPMMPAVETILAPIMYVGAGLRSVRV